MSSQCLCGNELTTSSEDDLYCSIQCARQDALDSLNARDPRYSSGSASSKSIVFNDIDDYSSWDWVTDAPHLRPSLQQSHYQRVQRAKEAETGEDPLFGAFQRDSGANSPTHGQRVETPFSDDGEDSDEVPCLTGEPSTRTVSQVMASLVLKDASIVERFASLDPSNILGTHSSEVDAGVPKAAALTTVPSANLKPRTLSPAPSITANTILTPLATPTKPVATKPTPSRPAPGPIRIPSTPPSHRTLTQSPSIQRLVQALEDDTPVSTPLCSTPELYQQSSPRFPFHSLAMSRDASDSSIASSFTSSAASSPGPFTPTHIEHKRNVLSRSRSHALMSSSSTDFSHDDIDEYDELKDPVVPLKLLPLAHKSSQSSLQADGKFYLSRFNYGYDRPSHSSRNASISSMESSSVGSFTPFPPPQTDGLLPSDPFGSNLYQVDEAEDQPSQSLPRLSPTRTTPGRRVRRLLSESHLGRPNTRRDERSWSIVQKLKGVKLWS